MPVTPTYPGVYIEEVPSGVHTITSVATSIAAFLGRASKGPMNKAVRLFSYGDYVRNFGIPHPKSDLADSVRKFISNGGAECYVIRLARNASSSSVVLENLNSQSVLVATAKAEGVWGDTVRLEVYYNTPAPDETFNLRVAYEEVGGTTRAESFTGLTMDPDAPRFAPSFVTNSSEFIRLSLHSAVDSGGANDLTVLGNSFTGFSQSRRPLGTLGSVGTAGTVRDTLNSLLNPVAPATPQSCFEIGVDGSPYVGVDIGPWTTAQINGATLANIRSRFQDRINDALDTVSAQANVAVTFSSPAGLNNLLTVTSDGAASTRSSVRIRRASSRDISVALMLGVDQGGIEPARYSNFRPAPTATILRVGNPANPGATGTLDQIAALTENAITSIDINTEVITLNAAPYNIQTTGNPANLWHQSAPGYSPETGENDGVREKLRIIANAITGHANLAYRAELWGYTLAITATSGTMNEQPSGVATAPTLLNTDTTLANSEFIANTRQYTLGTGGASTYSNSGTAGSDGDAPDAASYQGDENQQTGFHALDPVDLFNLMILPGDEEVSQATMMNLWGPASTYCKGRRAFLLIDPPLSWTDDDGRSQVVQNTSFINDLRNRLGDAKDHAAVFYPRLKYSRDGLTRTTGASGAIAGLMARIDANRGVWKAPAGVEAGIRGISGLNVKLTDQENGVLNKKGVSCLRVFPSGIVSWGARTLAGDDDYPSEWKYIPVRRLALMLEESLYRGTKWVVFEPNDEPLWAKIRLNVGAYMMSLFRQGAFQGTDPKNAFYVKCDRETTTQDDINKGIVNIEVGFAPLKPAEFVIIRIQQWQPNSNGQA